MSVEVAAYVFDGTYTAEEALQQARAAVEMDMAWIEDVAVIKRHNSGRVSVHSTWGQDDSMVGASVGFGALTGALLGALAGPGGALAGLFGGGTFGAFMGAGTDLLAEDPALTELADSLGKGTSALVLFGEVNPFVEAFADLGAKLVQTEIAAEVAEKLREKVLAS